MDLGDGEDALMHDGDIIISTEPHNLATQFISESVPEQHLDGRDSIQKLSEPPLRGTGVKREVDVFDYPLTKREDAPRPPKFKNLQYATSQTGLVYDVRMRFHVEAIPSEDDLHPEDPRRIHAIFQSFVDAGLAWREGVSGSEYYMGRIDTREVTKEEVCLVHTERHWDWIQQLRLKDADELEQELQHPPHGMDSVYLSAFTPFCAALSAGGAIEACRAILLGKVKNVFAVIRPPGHHAEREDAKGFCFYDNVSIATKVCQREFGESCRKVFILDWDVHHGNGIQQANYDDPNVLYVSLHVHKRGHFYPERSYRDNRGPYGDHLHCGAGPGLGKNVNIPWSKSGMGDADYIYAFQQVVMPIATEFEPDLVIIAAGFDAALGDMLGGCRVTPAGYAHMTHMLMSLADGKVAVCLEGGYNLESIARSATAVARTLMGEPPERLSETNPTVSGVDDVKLVLRQQSNFWSCLYPKDPSMRLNGQVQGERMHDIVRRWQAATLWDEYEMSPLYVYREQLSKSFENQVLATPNHTEDRPLLVILHDPPEMIASPDPRTGKLELHNTWLTDIVKTYIDWAVKQGFAVIDVSLPKHVTENDSQEHEESDIIEWRAKEATQLLTYLWDNYIEVHDPPKVFLLGTNTGHSAIINFIKANEDRAQDLLTTAISFVEDVPLQSCKSATNDALALWYHASSMVFIVPEHNFWFSDLSRKPKKRFGRVEKSPMESITDMLLQHRTAVFDKLRAQTTDWTARRAKVDAESMMGSSGIDAGASISPKRLPPISNFALSPTPKSGGFGPQQSRARSGSPTKMPPTSNFAASPRLRLSRSPGR